MGAVFLQLLGAPGHDGLAVTEVSFQSGTAQVRGLRGGGSGLHLIQQLLHVQEILHPQFLAFRQVQPVFLPIMAAVNLQGVLIDLALLQIRDQIRHRGDILVETVLVENPDAMAGTDGIARKQKVLVFQQIGHRAGRMTGNGNGLHFHLAEVQGHAIVHLPGDFVDVDE